MCDVIVLLNSVLFDDQVPDFPTTPLRIMKFGQNTSHKTCMGVRCEAERGGGRFRAPTPPHLHSK